MFKFSYQYREEATDEGSADGAAEGAAEAETTTEATEAAAEIAERPEWCDERFYDAETGVVNTENIHKSWKHANDKMSGKNTAPEAYDIVMPEGIEGDIDAESDFFQQVSEIAKKSGMDQESMNGLIAAYAGNMAQEQAFIAETKAAELAALGDNGQRRISDVNNWLSAQLPEGQAEALQNSVTTAGAVEALEALMSKGKGPSLVQDNVVSADDAATHEELNARFLAKDDQGNFKRQDPKYRRQFEQDAAAAGWQGL